MSNMETEIYKKDTDINSSLESILGYRVCIIIKRSMNYKSLDIMELFGKLLFIPLS